MTKIETRAFDVADHLASPEEVATYLQVALEESGEDSLLFRAALADALKAQQKMSAAAREAGISRQGAYKALSEEGNPSFDTVWKLLRAAGLTLEIKAAA